jgi:hypothetical protein
MSGFAKELVDESLGASSKRWALVAVALVIGAIGAWWLSGRAGPRSLIDGPSSVEPTPTPAPTLVRGAATQAGSAWRKVSTPPPVMRKALGATPFRNRRADPSEPPS